MEDTPNKKSKTEPLKILWKIKLGRMFFGAFDVYSPNLSIYFFITKRTTYLNFHFF